MAVHDLRSQEARNDAGVILRNVDRETMELEYQGRTLYVGVDRAPGNYGIYLPPSPVWTDGEPVDALTAAILQAGIREILGHWKISAEFLQP